MEVAAPQGPLTLLSGSCIERLGKQISHPVPAPERHQDFKIRSHQFLGGFTDQFAVEVVAVQNG